MRRKGVEWIYAGTSGYRLFLLAPSCSLLTASAGGDMQLHELRTFGRLEVIDTHARERERGIIAVL